VPGDRPAFNVAGERAEDQKEQRENDEIIGETSRSVGIGVEVTEKKGEGVSPSFHSETKV
jgi:hypothetical protein